ncbi:hypothetical protein A3A54_01335 [Candidatus Curtissbacteria bacterium RIFCSPLOWO2_01_FULL_39_62]|uniref:Uncharacterized protein n=2 Tax=Candidatus Curtissiibacteriota TaxID=1752717 RepID=A0A1F5G726_9BACT|nr:MAG: hypothetical protein A2775_00355 [Candidatus Curtissbacteria bacterium RIFCSPHIGHO2_01_FULL_39_57]OGD87658.1 MAG: hypothetical protein A3D04_02205 [Candidatus Curtissbacteria bacterium RIFCSPHIGHO2_02_FULL_40_16b]OGD90141.1 MAG: hypothetical protein A3E11_00075 [Candidatus Curtissbacteria bacterium RIFCSPHIGHO2_12_FULL_38_37]OGE00439.1 MAG: hypothetical protein A3A54_01335 [Candidatus Curtissbacteria bacterium RIFCSPLOWO2_01_FULL_39_62]OGE01024.1 MAG: hypothetical protein A3J17_03480 [C
MTLALIYAIVLAIVHFFSEKINIENKIWHARAVSFVAGVVVTYAFLSLLPETYEAYEKLNRLIFIFIVAGFTTVHVTEKYLYKHLEKGKNLAHSLKEVHSGAFFIYYLLIGAILVDLSLRGNIQMTLFYLPILFYGAVGVVSLDKIHHKIIQSSPIRFALSVSTIIGVLIADLLLRTGLLFDALFAAVIGAFIYVALIDFVPRERRGDPIFFVMGVVFYTLLITLLVE